MHVTIGPCRRVRPSCCAIRSVTNETSDPEFGKALTFMVEPWCPCTSIRHVISSTLPFRSLVKLLTTLSVGFFSLGSALGDLGEFLVSVCVS